MMAGLERVVLLACGSFNPPTIMHLRLFELARDYWRATQGGRGSEVVAGVISPTHDSYKKSSLIPATHRLEMARRATKDSDWVHVSDWEVRQEGWSRTRLVLDSFSDLVQDQKSVAWLPDNLLTGESKVCFKLLCGADLLESFAVPDLWKEDDLTTILRDYGMVVVSREGSNPEKFIYKSDLLTKYRNNIHIVTEWIANDVSSTKVRTAIRRSDSVKYLVPAPVVEYIAENNLYK